MLTFHVLYPYKENSRFDFDYYVNQHIVRARDALKPHGLVDATVMKGIDGGGYGKPPVYHCIASLVFNNREEMKAAFANADQTIMKELMEDVPNYTDVEPLMQISESL